MSHKFAAKFSPEVTAKILEGVSKGLPLSHAAQRAGISRRALQNWRARGRDEAEEDNDYAVFFRELQKAIAEGEYTLLAQVRQGEKGWQSAAWILERSRLYEGNWVKPREQITKDELIQLLTEITKPAASSKKNEE